MSPSLKCPRCDSEVPPDAPGASCLCCLLRLGLEPPLPRAFGKYELRRRIGSGGMGVIFEAQEFNPNRLVALKMIRTGELASSEEREWFRREAQAASRLEHRNIVTIFHVGDADEPPYYTMRLMTGGTLAGQRERLRSDPRRAAQIVATVARAVLHGHARGILHRDLKPANILLDEEGNPHVADFGIARGVYDEAEPASAGPLGTPQYMSPEQAGSGARQLTTKSDVYSLGIILFELLAGRAPFDGETSDEVLGKQRTAVPPRLRSLDPRIDRDLEAICLRCLEKDAERRCSADLLADDLERFLRGAPVAARPIGVRERGWRWSRRHPAAAGFVATAALSVLTLALAAISIARAQESERRQDVLKANAFAARSLAGLALFQLSQTVEVVERLAEDPMMIDRLGDPPGRFDPAIEEVRRRKSFVTIALQDTRGMAIARAPPPPSPDPYFRRSFAWTDHFKETKRRGEQGRREGYVARPSRSEATGDYKFTISAPVFGADGSWRGAVYASFATGSVLAHQRLDLGDDPRRTAALLARPDNDRATPGGPLPRGYVILVHDGLEEGNGTPVTSAVLAALAPPDPVAEQLSLAEAKSVIADDDYRDPVPGFEGRWLAGFSPVGNTGYVVVVQTRYSAILEPDQTLVTRLLWWAGLPLVLGGLAINLLLFFFRLRAT